MGKVKHLFEDGEKVIIKETGEEVTVDIWWTHDLSNTIRYNIKEHPFTWLSEWELEKVPTTKELIVGAIYLCADSDIRRLEEIEADYLHYSVPIGPKDRKPAWMRLSKTHRFQVEHEFINGRIIVESEV